jgi:hypothetical protein
MTANYTTITIIENQDYPLEEIYQNSRYGPNTI